MVNAGITPHKPLRVPVMDVDRIIHHGFAARVGERFSSSGRTNPHPLGHPLINNLVCALERARAAPSVRLIVNDLNDLSDDAFPEHDAGLSRNAHGDSRHRRLGEKPLKVRRRLAHTVAARYREAHSGMLIAAAPWTPRPRT